MSAILVGAKAPVWLDPLELKPKVIDASEDEPSVVKDGLNLNEYFDKRDLEDQKRPEMKYMAPVEAVVSPMSEDEFFGKELGKIIAETKDSAVSVGPSFAVEPTWSSPIASSMNSSCTSTFDSELLYKNSFISTLGLRRSFATIVGRSAARSLLGFPSEQTPVVVAPRKRKRSSLDSEKVTYSGLTGLQMKHMISNCESIETSVESPRDSNSSSRDRVIIDTFEMETWSMKFFNFELESYYLNYRRLAVKESAKFVICASSLFLLVDCFLSSISWVFASQKFLYLYLILSVVGILLQFILSSLVLLRSHSSVHAVEHIAFIFFVTFLSLQSLNSVFWIFAGESVVEGVFIDICLAMFVGLSLFQMTISELFLSQSLSWAVLILIAIFENYGKALDLAQIFKLSVKLFLGFVCFSVLGRVFQHKFRMLFLMDQRLASEKIGMELVYPGDEVREQVLPKVFISYKHLPMDRKFVAKIEHHLRNCGYDVWYDACLLHGIPWYDQIVDAIESCDVVIYVLSPDSVLSEFCKDEIDIAYKRQKPILPVILRDPFGDIPDDLNMMISSIQMVNFEGRKFKQAFQELTLALHRICSVIRN